MKKFITCTATMLMLSMFAATQLNAQDFARTNPKHAKILADTLGVKMIKVVLPPGEELVMHTHPAQMIYCIEGGQLTVMYKDGRKMVLDLNSGDAMQTAEEPPHVTKNTGSKPISFLDIEIKGKK